MKLSVRALVLLVVVVAGCEPEINREVLFVADSVTSDSSRPIVQTFNHVAAGSSAGGYAPNLGSVVAGQGLAKVPAVPADDVDEYWTRHVASLMAHVDPEVILV